MNLTQIIDKLKAFFGPVGSLLQVITKALIWLGGALIAMEVVLRLKIGKGIVSHLIYRLKQFGMTGDSYKLLVVVLIVFLIIIFRKK